MQTLSEYPEGLYAPGDTIAPRAVRLILCDGPHAGLTLANDCECDRDRVPVLTRYGVVGTAYGKLHAWHGGWKLWKSASPAYRAAREYVAL
jgi:hypothetical protein